VPGRVAGARGDGVPGAAITRQMDGRLFLLHGKCWCVVIVDVAVAACVFSRGWIHTHTQTHTQTHTHTHTHTQVLPTDILQRTPRGEAPHPISGAHVNLLTLTLQILHANHPKAWTLHPTPYTLNPPPYPKPLNSTPYTLNPRKLGPYTLNPAPYPKPLNFTP
jgi:hypothetical protein